MRPDGAGRAAVDGGHMHHVSFRHEPAAQSEAAYDHRIALPVEDLRTFGPEETLRLRLRRKDQEEGRQGACNSGEVQ